MIYVGTCGYAYKDWIGPFYPPRMRSDEMLPYYARAFAAVEIDSSYYGVPAPRTVVSMDRRTPPSFRFSFKAPQTVTHPAVADRVHPDAQLLLEAVAPLHQAGKLACVLAQFPNGFKADDRNRAYVARVIEAFDGVAVVVEFRHRAWQSAETMSMLRDLGAGWCNVDMPSFEELPHASSDATSAIGYVRMHGRNAAQWWTGTNVTRYQHDYTAEELMPWTERVAEIDDQTQQTYVFFNNHAVGKAAQNAEMFEALLDERYGAAAGEAIAHGEGGNPQAHMLPGLFGPETER